jgi:ribosomal protein S18 acetylase RimI-like enzyme
MRIVKAFLEVPNGISIIKDYNKKFITNFFPDESKVSKWIENKLFYTTEIGEVLFFIKKNIGFNSLFFIASSVNEFQVSLNLLMRQNPNLTFVADIVTKDENSEIIEVFEKCLFCQYTSLVRMSRFINEPRKLKLDSIINLKVASKGQLGEISSLLDKYFDSKAEQIPNNLELLAWVHSGSLLVYEINSKICGFIIYDLNGITLYLRYWFVHPDYRDKKIGSMLFNYFLYKGRNTKRQLLWVIKSNENAVKRYRHYGFFEEKMFNFVMINKAKI